jgi:hypothetical protein
MPDWLIFAYYVKGRSKDIIFYSPDTCLDLPVVYLAVDAALMQACANLFAVCH